MIKIEDMKFLYGKYEVFENLNLEFKENHIYGLLGKNGTGKSTLLYLISGLLKPKSGNIEFDGTDTFKRLPETLSDMFLVPDEFDFPDMKIGDFIKVYAPFYTNFSKEKFQNCLTDFGITEVKSLKGISLGQKKKIYISFALATGTRLLMFDEPTNGLDIPSKDIFRKIIAKNMEDGQTVIIATQLVNDVDALLDEIVIIKDSSDIFEATTSDIQERYVFENRMMADGEDVVYSEPSPQGYSVVATNTSGKDSQLDLNMLFKAVTNNKLTK